MILTPRPYSSPSIVTPGSTMLTWSSRTCSVAGFGRDPFREPVGLAGRPRPACASIPDLRRDVAPREVRRPTVGHLARHLRDERVVVEPREGRQRPVLGTPPVTVRCGDASGKVGDRAQVDRLAGGRGQVVECQRQGQVEHAPGVDRPGEHVLEQVRIPGKFFLNGFDAIRFCGGEPWYPALARRVASRFRSYLNPTADADGADAAVIMTAAAAATKLLQQLLGSAAPCTTPTATSTGSISGQGGQPTWEDASFFYAHETLMNHHHDSAHANGTWTLVVRKGRSLGLLPVPLG